MRLALIVSGLIGVSAAWEAGPVEIIGHRGASELR
jgi:hypothetical protein